MPTSQAWPLSHRNVTRYCIVDPDAVLRGPGPLGVIFPWVVHLSPTEETDGATPIVSRKEARVDIHKNAKLTPQNRAALVRRVIDSRVHAAFRESMEDFKSGRYSGPFDTAEQATASLHKIAGVRRSREASRR